MKKKILFFTPYYFPQSNAGVVRNHNFYKEIKKEFEVILLTSAHGDKSHSLLLKPKTNKSSFAIRLLFEILSGVELFFRVLFSNYDLYYFSSPNYFTVFIGALACFLRKKTYILDIRDIYPEVFFKANLIKENSLIGKICSQFSKFIYDHAAEITTVTPPLVELIKSQSRTRVHLITNGFDPHHFVPVKDKYLEFTCVFHGTLGIFQNLELVVELAKLSLKEDGNIKFLIIGDGPKSQVIKNALNLSNLSYLGQTDYKKLPHILNQAHIGLSFRTDDQISKDSFPVKIFEYMGMDLPIISTPNNPASHLIKKYNIGAFFENNQARDILKEILRLKNETRYYDLKVKNIQSIKHLYSREKQAKEMTGVLLKAMENK